MKGTSEFKICDLLTARKYIDGIDDYIDSILRDPGAEWISKYKYITGKSSGPARVYEYAETSPLEHLPGRIKSTCFF